ncbi:MAG: energy-converting hydrogenase subunit [Methanofollis sp.]|nr:energy-converting hydrogenase subunit [Methanofollis sp.]
MIEFLQVVLAGIVILGAVATAWSRDPFNKLICLSVLVGGVFPFIVAGGYLDVAIAVALITPITTIFVLAITGRNSDGA